MILGVQTHFAQGWSINLLGEAARLGTQTIRDSIRWGQTEIAPGVYDFSNPSAAWLNTALAAGAGVTLVFPGNGNSLYDGGNSVHTDEGRAAFARFIVATLKQYPNVQAIEIGNEYVGQNFVNGPIATQPLGYRDEYYAQMLAAVDRQIDQAGLSVRIIGGAAHSIPVDWFSDLKANGAFAHMDAVAIHPYSTVPEQFEDQVAVLRKAMGDTPLPIEVTEFGQHFKSLDEAPAYLAKMVSVMAAADIDRASWYALAKQKSLDNMELYDQWTKQATPAGKTFAFMEQLLARGDVEKVDVDDFTYLYTFGSSAAVIWGDPRDLDLGADVRAFDLSGNPIANFTGRIDEKTPIVLISTEPLVLGGNVSLGNLAIVADSFDQFDVANAASAGAGGEEAGPWSYFAQAAANDRLFALQTMGGGLRNGESWTPYLGLTWLRPLFISATALSPVDFGYRTVERYTSQTAQTVSIKGRWDVADGSADGIRLTIKQGQNVLIDQVVFDTKNGHVIDLNLSGIVLQAGDTIDFIVGANGTSRGSDRTERSITITADHVAVPTPPAALPELAAPPALKVVPVKSSTTTGTSAADSIDGSARSDRQKLSGGAGDDLLVGGAGNDKINGGAGRDHMIGGSGNDTYLVDNTEDRISESLNGGDDTVNASASYRLSAHVEDLVLTGLGSIDASGNDLANTLRGNAGDNRIFGFAGKDVITGGAGRDYLVGGLGADTLSGGKDSDTFVLDVLETSAERTTIKDFEAGIDWIAIERTAFRALAEYEPGSLAAEVFGIGTAARTPDQHLIYNPRAGALFYDPDGSGAAAQVQIALLWDKPILDPGYFILI